MKTFTLLLVVVCMCLVIPQTAVAGGLHFDIYSGGLGFHYGSHHGSHVHWYSSPYYYGPTYYYGPPVYYHSYAPIYHEWSHPMDYDGVRRGGSHRRSNAIIQNELWRQGGNPASRPRGYGSGGRY